MDAATSLYMADKARPSKHTQPNILRPAMACALAVALSACLALPALAQVPMVFEVTGDRKVESVYVQFLGDSIDGFYMDDTGDKHTLKTWTSYQLSSLSSSQSVGGGAPANEPAVMLNSFPAGRVYVNFGESDGQGGMDMSRKPDPVDPSNKNDPNFSKRYQFFEPTVQGTQLNVNLSYIDFFSIPLSLYAENAPHGANTTLATSASGKAFASAAAGAAKDSGSNVYPKDSLDKFSTFLRVLSPHSPPLAGDSSYYHDWSFLKDLKDTVTIEDFFTGVGDQPSHDPKTQQQSYKYSATFDNSGNVTMTGKGDGKASFIPDKLRGDGVGENTITITFSDLNAFTGIYGENPPYSVTNYNNTGKTHQTGGTENDLYGRVVGDLVAGLTWGFVGSTATFNGKTLGTLPSAYWWGGRLSDGTTIKDSAVKNGLVFENANSSSRYDHYAAALRSLTDAYAFPLQDRAGSTLMTFNTDTDKNAYLKVTIGGD